MKGGVFNILLNILELTGITLDGLGLVFNWSWLSIAKSYIISKQILRTLRGGGLSSSLGLRINVKLRKVKVRINFLGLTDNIIKAIRIGGPKLL